MSKNKDKSLIIIIIAILLIVMFFLFRPKKRVRGSGFDNFFGDLGENYIEDRFSGDKEESDQEEEEEDNVIDPDTMPYKRDKYGYDIIKEGDMLPRNGGLPDNKALGGMCVNKDYIKIALPNTGSTPITISLNALSAESGNQSIGQYGLDPMSGDAGMSSQGNVYVSQGSGSGTVAVINPSDATKSSINIPSVVVPPFSVGSGFAGGNVFSVAIQPDNKVVAVGAFTSYQGNSENSIIRLNSNGTKDSSFNTGTGFNGTVHCVVLQPDGKVLVGGVFTTYNGAPNLGIVRINTDGSADTSFNTLFGFNGGVYSIAMQTDGKVVAGGAFTTFNLVTNNYIVRLNSDGTLDGTFLNTGGFDFTVFSVAIGPDDRIVVGGAFSTYKGFPNNCICRIDPSGNQDLSFNNTDGFDLIVNSVVVQSDNKIIVGGDFTTYKLDPAPYIIRLQTDGNPDPSFDVGSGFDSFVFSLNIQPDGQVLVGGNFTSYDGISCNYITRLATDGSIDPDFNSGTGFNNYVLAVDSISANLTFPNGLIIAGGNFASYNGVSQPAISALTLDGDISSQIVYSTSIYGVYNPVTNAYYQVGGLFVTMIDTSSNTITNTFNVGLTIGSATNISVGQDGNLLIGNGDGVWGYMNGLTGAYLIAPVTVGASGDAISKAYLDSDGFLYFNFDGVASIIRLDTNPSSGTYLSYQTLPVGLNSGPFYVYLGFLYYFSSDGLTLYKYNLISLAIETSLVLPSNNTAGNISFYAGRLIIAGNDIMLVDPVTMTLIGSLNLETDVSNTIVTENGYLYSLSSSNIAQVQITNLNIDPIYLLETISQGGFGVAGRSLFLTPQQTIVSVTSGGIDNLLRIPVYVSNDVKAKFDYANYNPVKVCGIKYTCNTVEQLGNPLIFVLIDGVTGIKSEYRISLIDRLSTQQFNNIIYIDNIQPPLVLYSNQSIVHTINAGENVLKGFYKESGINRSNDFAKGSTNSDIGGNILSMTSVKPVTTEEYYEDIEPSTEEIENDYEFDEIILDLDLDTQIALGDGEL